MLEIKNLQKNFGSHAILKNINLSVDAGEFVVLVGPSGCGKSTLLRTIAGLEQPTSGEIFIAGKNVTALEPQNRDVAMVFQNYALYPHMTVYENMAFGLRVRKLDRQEIENRVKSTAQLLKMEPLLERTPKELSGGQRQRVALGRALARRAPVLLFDEPPARTAF
jgi:ABC-type sugar transport system ATPase subunit